MKVEYTRDRTVQKEGYMNSLNSGILALVLGLGTVSVTATGCTATQVKQAEDDLVKLLRAASVALATANTPATQAEAEAALSALAAVAPQTGPVHQAIVDAQAALNALQKNQGSVVAAQVALDTAIGLLESQGAVPLGAVRRHAVAPVTSK